MSLISQLHSYIRRPQLSRQGRPLPTEEKVKEYERMPVLQLPKPATELMSLDLALEQRTSFNQDSINDNPISLNQLGSLLWYALGIKNNSDLRQYPSGGGLYPIETYLLGQIEGQDTFVYHYNPTKHSLEELWAIEEKDLERLMLSKNTPTSDLFLVFTAMWERSSYHYADLAYSHCLLEAGHMAQNVLLVATALGLKTRPISGFDDDLLSETLDLNQKKEQPVYGIFLAS